MVLRWGDLFEKIRYGILLGLVNLICSSVSIKIVRFFGGTVTGTPDEFAGNATLSLFILHVVAAPAIEELLFRLLPGSTVLEITDRRTFVWGAVLLSSFFWAWLHGGFAMFFVLLPSAIILSYGYIRFGYMTCFTAHALNNFVVFLAKINLI